MESSDPKFINDCDFDFFNNLKFFHIFLLNVESLLSAWILQKKTMVYSPKQTLVSPQSKQ